MPITVFGCTASPAAGVVAVSSSRLCIAVAAETASGCSEYAQGGGLSFDAAPVANPATRTIDTPNNRASRIPIIPLLRGSLTPPCVRRKSALSALQELLG